MSQQRSNETHSDIEQKRLNLEKSSVPKSIIPPAHLRSRESVSPASPDLSAGRAFPITDPTAPREDAEGVLGYLNVAKAARYKPSAGYTYCNIFAADYCYLMGVYLPRVWWTQKAIDAFIRGDQPAPVPSYGATVLELNANAICAWLGMYGKMYGWVETPLDKLEEAQFAVNAGAVAVISASTGLNRPGHISVIIPENEEMGWRALAGADGEFVPVQAQAGAQCWVGRTVEWWHDAKHYPKRGCWVNYNRVKASEQTQAQTQVEKEIEK